MLFYTFTFVACLVVTFFVIFLVANFKSFLHTAIENKTRPANTSYQRITVTSTSRDYQRKGPSRKWCYAIPTRPVQDFGVEFSRSGKQPLAESVACRNQDTSWFVREKKLVSMYEAYAARRSAEPEPRTLEMICKPFRRTSV